MAIVTQQEQYLITKLSFWQNENSFWFSTGHGAKNYFPIFTYHIRILVIMHLFSIQTISVLFVNSLQTQAQTLDEIQNLGQNTVKCQSLLT